MPPAKDAMLSELTMSTGPHGSQMDIDGLTRRFETIAEMEEGVRDLAGSKMSTGDSKEDSTVPPYAWRFKASVMIEKEPGKEAGKASSVAAPQSPAKSTAGGTAPGAPGPVPAKSSAASASTNGPTAAAKSSGTQAAPKTSTVTPAKSSATGAAP